MPEAKGICTPEQAAVERWERETVEPLLHQSPEMRSRFESVSLEEVNRLYTAADISQTNIARDISFPGEFPYTRGIHPTGYRGKLWTMRQFAGFSTPEQTNARFKYLLAEGQNGLSVAYDLPTLMGYDADSTLAEGEVGKCGVQSLRWPTWKSFLTGFRLSKSRFRKPSMRPLLFSWQCTWWWQKAGRRLEKDLGHPAK